MKDRNQESSVVEYRFYHDGPIFAEALNRLLDKTGRENGFFVSSILAGYTKP